MIKWIADIGSNHSGDLERTHRLICAAKEIGCHAVKFQMFTHDHLYHADFPKQRTQVQSRELPIPFLSHIAMMCKKVDVEFHCTPFDLDAVQFIKPYVDAYKIGSYEILNHKLIEACAKTGKPLSIAGGNCSMDELKDAFLVARPLNHRVTVYHCASYYPAKPEQCNVRLIEVMKDKFETIGWSDHSVNPAVIFFAIAYGAKVIEFHLDLNDERGDEFEHGHCWTVEQMSEVIDQATRAEGALNADPSPDLSIRKWRMDPEDGLRPLKQYRDELKCL